MSALPASSSGMSVKQSSGAETNIMVQLEYTYINMKLFEYQQNGIQDEHGSA